MDNWISVEDRLPVVPPESRPWPHSTKSLVSGVGKQFLVAYYDGRIGICTVWTGEHFFPDGGITHWMPLPAPPAIEK